MRYTLRSFLQSLFLFSILVSCQKELNSDNSNPTGTGTAIYILEGAPGTCLTPTINGTYTAGVVLNAGNSVMVTVNVSTIGTYAISTATINGIRFSGTGTFVTPGIQTITLGGTGNPTAAGTHIFTPGTNGCTFSITTTAAGVPGVFTLAGAPNACTAPTIAGTYQAGVAMTASNTVQLSVNVTTPGNYNINSAVVNGFSFSGSGILAVGNQTITLKGNGTPLAAGPFVFTPLAGGCSFTINVTTAGGSSVFTLTGAPGACTAPVVAGTYTAGTALTAGNTFTVTANVTTAGTYNLSTNTVNGISFSASGTLAAGAGQVIVLRGTGTPSAANTSSFNLGTGGCSFTITTVAPPPAIYTFTGAPGACNPITVNGSYFVGGALNALSNTVAIEVNVTTAGAYTISSNTINGMVFSKTGVFSTTGTQTVVLAGSGTPLAVGTNTFTAGIGGCTFPLNVTVPSSPCTGLVDGKFVMTNQFTLNGFSFGIPFNGKYQVTIQDPPVQIDVLFPGTNPPAVGSHSIGLVTMYCLASNYVEWTATSGTVYVSIDGSGNRVVEFCNVNFRGVPFLGGSPITSTGSGKMVF